MRRRLALLAAALLVAAGCSGEDDNPKTPLQSPLSTHTSSEPPAPSPSTTRPSTIPGPEKERVRRLGIDASHHQGPIDWDAVANDGISFAYLKATEGTTYTDPTFADHRARAHDHGLDGGGYHYFQLCSPGVEQAEHFVSVLGDVRSGNHLPPAVDLEIAGSCSIPPPRQVLLAEVRAFLRHVADAAGREPVVYLYPDFEERFGFAAELDDYRQWVRSLNGRPTRPFWIWQQTDSGSVDGIEGPVDVNVMWRHEIIPR
ncbi:glycoside hydrolase family 25 protein [Nocardioides antri]|uniref:glycoside hydrolase family 25 protein n=1 Tax=Nocardioides antri TaxID=2607659 RepID=UPI00165FA2FC|nr:GH25 family lysozyme [Nocardioides antri]